MWNITQRYRSNHQLMRLMLHCIIYSKEWRVISSNHFIYAQQHVCRLRRRRMMRRRRRMMRKTRMRRRRMDLEARRAGGDMTTVLTESDDDWLKLKPACYLWRTAEEEEKDSPKATLCRIWYFVWFGAPYRFRVQRHCLKHRSQVCHNLSDVMSVQTTGKNHDVITICVENLHVKLIVYTTIMLYNHVPSKWFEDVILRLKIHNKKME